MVWCALARKYKHRVSDYIRLYVLYLCYLTALLGYSYSIIDTRSGSWSEIEAREKIEYVSNFVDNVQELLLEGLSSDFETITKYILSKYGTVTPVFVPVLSRDGYRYRYSAGYGDVVGSTGGIHYHASSMKRIPTMERRQTSSEGWTQEGSNNDIYNKNNNKNENENEKDHGRSKTNGKESLINDSNSSSNSSSSNTSTTTNTRRLSTEICGVELEKLFRKAVRRQVEIEIYFACRQPVNTLLSSCFGNIDKEVFR